MIERRLAMGQGEEILQMYIQHIQQQVLVPLFYPVVQSSTKLYYIPFNNCVLRSEEEWDMVLTETWDERCGFSMLVFLLCRKSAII